MMLERFNINYGNTLTAPLWLHVKLSEKDCPNDDVAINQFMFTKRAGIAHVVGVSRFMANLSKVH